MDQFLTLVAQRRIWAGIVGVLAFLVETLHLGLSVDIPVLTDLLTGFGASLAALASAALALHSYFKPKSGAQTNLPPSN